MQIRTDVLCSFSKLFKTSLCDFWGDAISLLKSGMIRSKSRYICCPFQGVMLHAETDGNKCCNNDGFS